jgi:hypothetical protein
MTRLPLLCLVAIAACFGPPPGKGTKPRRAYRNAPPVIAAIEQYHVARGYYPLALDSLVPEFLPRPALLDPPAQEHHPWEYRRDSTGYVLTFRYTGPGMNYCEYSSKDPHWHCHGYF